MERYLEYFYMISEIPRGSGNTKHIAEFLMQFAKAHGLSAKKDEHNNVTIVKEAHPEMSGSAPVILQGHIDMVAVKDEGVKKDLLTEGLSVYEENGELKAAGTSLGGDDGIGVAYMLALLAGDYRTPKLECVFTSDEEVGMLGAAAYDTSVLTGKRMINLDHEDEGQFVVGCAGGVRLSMTIPVRKEVLTGSVFEIRVSGLKGGHSGTEIDKKRGNAVHILADELCKLNGKTGFNLAEINGGTADNAIPNTASARILLSDTSDTFQSRKEVLSLNGKELFFGTPADVDEGRIEVKELGKDAMIVLDLLSTDNVTELLRKAPDGVIRFDPHLPSFPETSLNLGILCSNEDDITVDFLIRSSRTEGKEALVEELCKLAEEAGGTCRLSGDYPGWAYKEDSELREKMIRIYEEMYLCKPEAFPIHAGLECGVFSDRIPGLDCIAMGPTIRDIHTTAETLVLESADRMWAYLLKVLEQL
ncbi:MAG: beta-Ala-His dipeptidase [Lachnospiraceae bacterium]|nr:beta-Ala-His dipeptidase [Lachnospiraceae bacterium]